MGFKVVFLKILLVKNDFVWRECLKDSLVQKRENSQELFIPFQEYKKIVVYTLLNEQIKLA